MRLSNAYATTYYALLASNAAAFSTNSHVSRSTFRTDLRRSHSRATLALNVASSDEIKETVLSEQSSSPPQPPVELNYEIITGLKFRELQKECKERGLGANGNTAALRNNLLDHVGIVDPMVAVRAAAELDDDTVSCVCLVSVAMDL